MKSDVLIIGGGAAGLTAALSASRQGGRATVLEAAPRIGRKILASGNGRCNLANMGPARYPGGAAFAGRVLGACPPDAVRAFFHSLGLVTVEESQGRVYPGCGQAAAVLDVIRAALERAGVTVICGAPVEKIERTPGGLRATAEGRNYEARALVAACGGMAGGKLGHDGAAYSLLTGLGHSLVPPRPALTPLVAEKGAVRGLSGLRLPAILSLRCRKTGRLLGRAQGEALFTDYGVSGVCAMELARRAQDARTQTGAWPLLEVDFSPTLGLVPRAFGCWDAAPDDAADRRSAALAWLRERQHMLPSEALLRGAVPRLLAERLQGRSLSGLAEALTAFPVPLAGVKGMDNAQVTAGGIETAEFDAETLASRLVPGLYAAGEMLDVDGGCGGYNLQFAFASGLIAGENAARTALNR